MTAQQMPAEFPAASHAEWETRVAQVLKGAEFETLVGRSADGIRIEPLYERRTDAPAIPDIRPAKPWRVRSARRSR